MKNVLMVSRAISPPWDEASRNLVKEIVSRTEGLKFHVLTDKEKVFNGENIVHHKIYTSRENTFFQKLKLLMFLFKRRKEFDVYHLCFTPEKASSFFIKAMIDKRKVIQSVPYLTEKVKKGDYKRLIHSESVIVPSEATKNELAYSGIKNAKVIPPGVDTKRFSPERDRALDKKKFNLTGKKNIIWAGDLSTGAALEKLFIIMQDVLADSEEAIFVIASRIKEKRDSVRHNALKVRVKDLGMEKRVIFMQTVDDMASLISACEILIYPLMPGFKRKIDVPYVVVEAMASGLPVVISDVAPLNEAIKDGVEKLVKGEDPLIFAEEVKKLINDDSRCRDISGKNRKVALRFFDIEKNIKKIREVYEAVNG